MCDFSLQHAKSRPAVIADKLRTHNFGRGTRGFTGVDDPIGDATAVCVLPGTEIGFTDDIRVVDTTGCVVGYESKSLGHKVAIFRQVHKDKPSTHHDALELPDGTIIMLTHLIEGQQATVLQLPAAPRDEAEAEEQRRLEVVG